MAIVQTALSSFVRRASILITCAALPLSAPFASAEAKRVGKITADELIRIEISAEDDLPGRRPRKPSRKPSSERLYDADYVESLHHRIRRLERAVVQLQDIVLDADGNPRPVPSAAPSSEYSCYVKTFGRTYLGKGSSEVEARALALQACAKGESSGISCDEDDLKCGKS